MSTHTATLGTAEQAEWLASGLIALDGSPAPIQANGRIVTLTANALTDLAFRPSDYDGHFDGQYIWIGGTEYLVETA